MLGKRNRVDGESPSENGNAASSNPPEPRVVHEKPPSVVCTDAEHFKAVVQSLTGSPKTRHAAGAILPPHLLRQVAAAIEEQLGDSPTNSSNTELSTHSNSVSVELRVGADRDDAAQSSAEALANGRSHRFLPPSAAVRDASVGADRDNAAQSSAEALANGCSHRFLPPSAAVRDASVGGAVRYSSNS